MALIAAVLSGCGAAQDAPPPAETEVIPAVTVTPAAQEVGMAQAGDRVSVHYRGTLDSGEEFDSSQGRDPLPFTIGAGEVIAGFDQAVTGMAIGDKKTVRIPAEE
ncbi:MAG: FKBP-type peptidyl-prolyl cis-trans isomerase, partial [Chloroflexi bacterium]|nr:FKBP-type peptidyl-prolyl cis-trans isomerase [Chloroflexota bacterium]